MAEILIHCNHRNYSHSNTAKDESGVYKKGYPVVIFEDGHKWGSKETLPRFVLVKVTDAAKTQVEAMIASAFGGTSITQEWRSVIDWNVIGSDTALDKWRLRLFTENPGASNKAGITRAKVETFINQWGGEVVNEAVNATTFDLAVYDAVCSQKFWNADVSAVVFSELSYTVTGAVHQVRINYSAASFAEKAIKHAIENRGGVIDDYDLDLKTADFTITRSDVLDVFKKSLKSAVEKTIYRRQFRVSEAAVDNIISQDGEIEITLTQLQNYLMNRLND